MDKNARTVAKSTSKKHNYKWIALGACLFFAAVGATVILLHVFIKPAQIQKTDNQPVITKSTPSAPQTAFVWKSAVDPHSIPLGDGHVASQPQTNYIYSCSTSFRGGGAQHAGPWINQAAGTWDSTAKVAVQGSVSWPTAQHTMVVSGANRIITTNDLPLGDATGIFPIARTDPAYQYDRNPNSIVAQSLSYQLPVTPAVAATPSCLSLGAIGVMTNGVLLFDGLDDGGRDAVAHETQDSCDGHPDGQQRYHYHSVPSCLTAKATGSSTLVGYAMDGFGIYVERDSKGNLPTNADLDVCHGRTSAIEWDGKSVTMYHYDATLEYPYTVGCFKGTPVVTNTRPM